MDFQGGDDDGTGGGGGYSNGGINGTPSPSQGQRTRRSYDEQSLIPVTVQMAMSAQQDPSGGDGSLVLRDGRAVSIVKIVGAIRSFSEQSTNVVYSIEDGTGLIDVKQWVDDNDCSALLEIRKETLKENIYVKAVGQIKEFDGKKLLVASSVRPLSTGNELTHHMLEVVYSSEKSKREETIIAPVSNSGVGFGGMPVSKAGAAGGSLTNRVLEFIKSNDPGTETGVNIEDCITAMPNYSPSDIRQAVSFLSDEGHVYSTISDNHFKLAG